jgi:hypothetical protein
MLTMTKPKKRKPGAGRPKGPSPPRRTIASFKGSEEFEVWFAELVDHCRIPASSVIELALICYARQEGFKGDPPRR